MMKPKVEQYQFPNTMDFSEEEDIKEDAASEDQEEEMPEAEETAEDTPLSYAEAQARALLEQADAEAEKIKENARLEAAKELEQIREGARSEGFREGYAEGLAKGMEEGRKGCEEQAKGLASEVKQFLEQASVLREELLDKTQDDMRDLAIAIAEKVIRVSLKSSSGVIGRMIQGATEKLKRREWVHIYVSSCDHKELVAIAPQLTTALGALSDHIKIVPMSEEEEGTCIIETPDTIIDASVSTQVSNIRSILEDISAKDDGAVYSAGWPVR